MCPCPFHLLLWTLSCVPVLALGLAYLRIKVRGLGRSCDCSCCHHGAPDDTK